MESFSLRPRSALQCWTLCQSRPRLAELVPLVGKVSVSNITVQLGFVVVPKALATARLSAVASRLAILPPSISRFCPLAPCCPVSWHLTAAFLSLAGTLLLAVGWHPTARRRLAPYCSPSAGTLLLAGGWHPTARRRLAPYCWPSAGTLLLAVGWHPTATLRLAPYCSSSLASIPSARWLRATFFFPL